MQLSSRGCHYKGNIKEFATQNSQINGKYRGVSYQISKPTVFPTVSQLELKYRGATYIHSCH